MFRKVLLLVLIALSASLQVNAQQDTTKSASRITPAFQHLLLELGTTYFTVVKENLVDLDSSLIHVSSKLSISRLPIVAEGLEDKVALSNVQWVDQREPWIGQKQLSIATGEKHALLSILLGAYYAFEPGNDTKAVTISKDYLNAGIKECIQSNNIRLRLAGQRLLAKLYLKSEKFAEADRLFATVKDGFINAGDLSAAATTYSWWGLYAPVTATSTTPRIEHTEMAVQIFKSLGDKEGQINSLMNDSYLHMLRYDMPGAEKLAKQAYILAKSVNFPYSHYVSGALMSITLFEGKFGEPLTYGVESVNSAETARDNLVLPYFYGVIAGLYENEGNRQEIEIAWEQKSINSFLSQHELDYMEVYRVVGYLIDRGKKSYALKYLNKLVYQVPPKTSLDYFFYNLILGYYAVSTSNWVTAHTFYNKAATFEKEAEKHGLGIRRPTLLYNMAILFYKEGKYKKAKIYFNQYLSQPSIINGGFFGDNAGALSFLINIDSLTGDHKNQINDYRRYTDVIVQNYTVSKTKLAEELQVKYATSAKINEINMLSQKSDLAQANLKQANLIKNITVAGIILLIFIVGLLYRQSKIRKKSSAIITRKNMMMQKLLEEKEWLLKEIHHRVKNNLHTIICLLESQAAYLEDDALKAVESSQHRIYAMSLIHQKLYQSDDIKVVNMNTYLTEFVEYLRESFGSPINIRVVLQAEHIKLGVAQAIPIGLIINEAVNNAFKYAFPQQKRGLISIELKRIEEGIFLSITDNGIGFKKQTDQEVNSLGLELIKGLTSDLRGTLNLNTASGTSIQIRFKIDHVGIPADGAEIQALNF